MKKLTAFLLCALVIMPCFQTALSQDDKLIELSPKEINIVAKQGETATATMGIFNRGSSSLLFSLSKSYSKAKTQPLASPDGNMLVYPSFLDFGTVPSKGEVSQTVTCTAPTEQYLQVTASSDKYAGVSKFPGFRHCTLQRRGFANCYMYSTNGTISPGHGLKRC